jgi:hypothetical protein
MVGDPSDPIIADAHAFGATGFNATQALTDMETEANVPNNIRPGLDDYMNDGYLPIDGTYGCCNFYGPVSTQEEYNAADSSIASLAQALGKTSYVQSVTLNGSSWDPRLPAGDRVRQGRHDRLDAGHRGIHHVPAPPTTRRRPTPRACCRRSDTSAGPAVTTTRWSSPLRAPARRRPWGCRA